MKLVLLALLALLTTANAQAECDLEAIIVESVGSFCGYPASRGNTDALKVGAVSTTGSLSSFNFLVACKNYDFFARGLVRFDPSTCVVKETLGKQIRL